MSRDHHKRSGDLADEKIVTGYQRVRMSQCIRHAYQLLTASHPLSSRKNPYTALHFTGDKLYGEYLRREGRPDTAEGAEMGASQGSRQSSARERERREVDDQFRDF